MKRSIQIVFAACLACTAAEQVLADLPRKIKLATTDWCPYACPPPSAHPGFVHEYVTDIVKKGGMEIEIKSYPWARAVLKANAGEVDGLLTAVPDEAPNLLFTTSPIMSYQVCFFTGRDTQWMYNGESSLNKVRLGVIEAYAYGPPLDAYIKNPANQKQLVTLTGTEGVKRLFLMLQSKRMDAFVDDQYVVEWSATQHQIEEGSFKNAGCVSQNPFYLAVNPNMPYAKEFIAFLNERFSDKTNQALLKELIKKYRFEVIGK